MNDWRLAYSDVQPDHESDGSAGVNLAVIGQLNPPGQNAAGYEINRHLTNSVLQELTDLGANFTFVDVSDDSEPDYEMIAAADLVLILGGGDVEASRYGHFDPVPNESGVDPRSDERQLRVIADAVAADQALLAICRGSQLLNVASGGTLIPDLPEGQHRGFPGEPLFIDDQVEIDPDSLLGTVFPGRTTLTVRNGHHQAVDRVGDNLRVIARAADGVIEGTMRTDKRWIWGVQWHPEDRAGSVEDRRAFFTEVVREAQRRRNPSN